jgi:predicted RNA-binding protein with RPS1 domain
LHHQRLVNHAAKQILLLLLELRVNLVLLAALTIARGFVAQLLFGFLIIGERDDVAVYARDDVSGRHGLGLRARGRRKQRREQSQQDEDEAQG